MCIQAITAAPVDHCSIVNRCVFRVCFKPVCVSKLALLIGQCVILYIYYVLYTYHAKWVESVGAWLIVAASRSGVCMDTSSHCRLVDDSKLLTKNLTTNLECPESCRNLPAACAASPGSDATSPKVADVHRSNTASLLTNTSLEPLLRPRPDIGNHVAWCHVNVALYVWALSTCDWSNDTYICRSLSLCRNVKTYHVVIFGAVFGHCFEP